LRRRRGAPGIAYRSASAQFRIAPLFLGEVMQAFGGAVMIAVLVAFQSRK
jgi:hypothetical protein